MNIEDIRAGFAGKAHRTVSFDLLEEDYQAAVDLFRSRGVDADEGFRVAAMAGVTEMKREADANLDDDSLMKQLNRMEGAYIGMKNKAYLLNLDNERMELSHMGWVRENERLTDRVFRLETELEFLRAGEQVPPIPTPSPADDPDNRNWWERIRAARRR